MAVSSIFVPATGVLTTTGDNLDNAITTSRDAAGNILVNGGAVPIQGGTPTVANTTVIQVFGLDGSDTITLDEANGALPRADLFGGNGNDVVTGGSGADQLFGQDGNDTLLGKGGNDLLFGGDGNDTLTGGDGDDQMFGEAGDDRMIWNPGDDTDLAEGGDGIDTAEVNGGDGAEVFTATANGTRVRFDRLTPAPFSIDIGTTEKLVLNMNGGDDSFSATGNLAALIGVTVDGGAGNDTILGSNGADVLLGGDGNDFIDGQQGNDTAFLGAGDDVFQWDPGDGSDVVEGQDGTDTLLFNGSAANEIFDVSANGGRALFTRNVGNIVMDINDVETVNLNALGGTDTVTVNDLSGTDVTRVNINLAGTIGGSAGDGQADTVTVNGTNGDDVLGVLGSGTAVAVAGLQALVNITASEGANDALVVNGGGGNDTISAATVPAGITKLTLDGGAGNDTLVGSQGADLLHGGDGNDTLTGGDGDDQMFGEAGDDRMIWNPGDDTDLAEGGDGTDTVEVNGGNGAEVFTVTANGTRVRFDRLDPAPFSIDIGTTEKLVLNMNGGDDSFSATGNLAALIGVTVDGGTGNDTILGSNGADTLLGGDGNDFIDGNQGNDTAFLGAGDDVFQWDPGDGSDVVEGQAGTDTLLFNGSAANEIFDVSANGGRALFTRNVGNIVMDINDVETVNLNALGGADTVTVNDLSGTDVTQVNINLAGTIGGTTGDAQADSVIVNGTNGGDVVQVLGSGTSVAVAGLQALVNITASEGANDTLVVNGGGGNDNISAAILPAGVTKLTLDGGAGDDLLAGSSGADLLIGGDGNDFVDGNRGDDTALLGAGNDTFQWDPGDGNDTVEGQDGADRLNFNGANISENIDISANGGRVRFVRDVANVTMDLDNVEVITFQALGGADNIVVNDLSGTDLPVGGVLIDLASTIGGTTGDGQVDRVTVNGTAGNEAISIRTVNGFVGILGSSAPVAIFHAESTDQLVVNGNAGNDTINASDLTAGQISLTLNGGLGADVLIGSQGNDIVFGGDGDDTAVLGAGNDSFVWNPGDDNDTVEGQTGTDRLVFNGANVSETIDITANGTRARFFRDVANVTMDLNQVEHIEFNALGGSDVITVNNLTGTDVTQVDVNLSSTLGGTTGDAQADTVIVNGTNGVDIVQVVGAGSSASVVGLAALVNITGSEGANDALVVNGGGGNDNISAATLPDGITKLTLDGGAGDDILAGSSGADLLIGGDGNDFVDGNRGDDTALLGAGNDTFQWDPGDGNDTVEGQDGADRLNFNGANISENIDISANGGRVRFVRDVANVTMDLDNVEVITFQALGGADNIVVNDLSGTDLPVGGVLIDLASTIGGTTGDGQVDRVTVNGTAGNEAISIRTVNGFVGILGSSAPVAIFHAESTDQLVVNGNAGNDTINASDLTAGQISLTLNGGLGADVLIGSQGNDIVFGGDGDDTAVLGAGNDSFVWNPGDDNDTVEGQTGTDRLVFNGANVSETIDITANGTRARFFRDVANVTMDLNQVEHIEFNALGGSDVITVNNLTGTDVTQVDVNLSSTLGGTTGDAQADTVIVNGTNGVDIVQVVGAGSSASVVGLAALVNITGSEGANDALVVNGGGGNDNISAATLPDGITKLTLDGGDGNDVLFGGQGNDSLVGGNGDDTVIGGPGNDALTGGAGNDVLVGGVGVDSLSGGVGQDTFLFTGASLATLATGVGANRDVVQDFTTGDTIHLVQVDANLNVAGDQAFSFIGTNAFTAAGQIRFFADGAGNTIIEGNMDGNLGADFQIELHAFTSQLQATDFLL